MGQGGAFDHLRHCSHGTGNRLWLYQGRLEPWSRGAMPWPPGRSSGSSKSRISRRPERYMASGEYFWNSGMFMFRAAVYLRELEMQAPAMLAACRNACAGATRDLDFIRLDAACLRRLPGGFHRLRGDGEDRRRRGHPPRCRLERCRFLVGSVGGRPAGDRWQRRPSATSLSKGRKIPTSMPAAGWWRRSAWKTRSSSKPPTRCWSPARTGCRR